jgi:hypothetical protein
LTDGLTDSKAVRKKIRQDKTLPFKHASRKRCALEKYAGCFREAPYRCDPAECIVRHVRILAWSTKKNN